MAEAEARALYFGALSSRYNMERRWINGIQLFLASGAAVTIAASAPSWIPVIMSAITAGLTAYSIATELNRKVGIAIKLHCEWNRIASDYRNLWDHWTADDADQIYQRIRDRDLDASELGLELKYDEDLSNKWSDRAYDRYKTA